MLRRAFSMLWAVSLVFLVATVALWVRSHGTLNSLGNTDLINIKRTEPIWWIVSSPGRATLCRQVGRDWDKHDLRQFNALGIDFGGGWGPGSMLWNLSVPYWMLATLFATLPIVRLEMWRRSRREARRRSAGRCATCGYDLRATPDRCPECGSAAAAIVSEA